MINNDKDWERESEKVRKSLPSGVKGSIRVLNRRVEAVSGEPWFEVFIATGDPTGCEISYDLEIKSGDSVELKFPSTTSDARIIEGRVEWVRKNAMPILGRYSCRINMDIDKDKKGSMR